MSGENPPRIACNAPHSDIAKHLASHEHEDAPTFFLTCRLDREWATERESLMVRNQDGGTSEPNEAGSMFGGIVLIAAGIVWGVIFTASESVSGIVPLFGLVIIGIGIFNISNGSSKAGKYSRVQSIYQQRRFRMIREIEVERKKH
jgi:hypothetical protein